ncbi:MAG: spermidine/putrescine ABC transporter ATP-binding protein [Tissierellaceae bacterium]|jgi:spermidine/putrescine transport system ATP-binding protein|nr:ABC transporter ATP-binding protein [Tissierellia bacterium]
MNIIDLENITMEYDGLKVLDDINLSIRKNEFLTLLGPSGCGKTTTLRIIGGFEEPTQGRVIFEGKDISKLPPYKRRINTVFQKYALFPHLDVFGNIAFGLKIKKVPNHEIEKRVKEMLRLVDLRGFENRSIESLSGGQQQRIAIARALVNEPEVLLLDEPLGALDLKLRKEMQIELKNIQQRIGITFIYVTHDQEEALTMSDTIVVMNQGKIQQIGSPIDIYNEPKNAFVAKFIGESNIIDGIMHNDFIVEFSGKTFDCVDKGFNKKEKVEVVIRPEDLEIVPDSQAKLKGTVESVTFKGVHYEMFVKVDDFHWMVHSTIMKEVGSEIGLNVLPENIHIMKKVVD